MAQNLPRWLASYPQRKAQLDTFVQDFPSFPLNFPQLLARHAALSVTQCVFETGCVTIKPLVRFSIWLLSSPICISALR